MVAWLFACGGVERPRDPTAALGPNAGAPTVAAEEPDTAPGFPRLHLVVHNFAADEGEVWTYDLDGAGVLVADGWMSNGGETRTVWRCRGRIASEQAAAWLARLETAATLATAPALPSAGDALARGQTNGFEVGYARTAGVMTYADPAASIDWLAELLVRLNEAKRCTTSSDDGQGSERR